MSFPTKVRALIHERSNMKCERCGFRRGVHAHHRRPRGMGGDKRVSTNSASAGLWLCLYCHSEVESHRSEAVKYGWIVPRHSEPCEVPVLYHRTLWVLLDDEGGYRLVEAVS